MPEPTVLFPVSFWKQFTRAQTHRRYVKGRGSSCCVYAAEVSALAIQIFSCTWSDQDHDALNSRYHLVLWDVGGAAAVSQMKPRISFQFSASKGIWNLSQRKKKKAVLYAFQWYMQNIYLYKNSCVVKYWSVKWDWRFVFCAVRLRPRLLSVFLHVGIPIQSCWFDLIPVDSFSSPAYFVTEQLLPFTLQQDGYMELVLFATQLTCEFAS